MSALKDFKDNTVPIHLGFNRRFDPGHVATRDAMILVKLEIFIQVIITSRDPGLPSYGVLSKKQEAFKRHDYS